jgi:hypothetical protein
MIGGPNADGAYCAPQCYTSRYVQLGRATGSRIDNLANDLTAKYGKVIPMEWGENVTGVRTKIGTGEHVMALTFDACGTSELSKGYDRELINS